MILQKGTLHSFQRELHRDLYCLKQMETNSFATMLDVGANTGIVAIWARLLHPNMRIISIEPHPKTFIGLAKNVAGMHIEAYNYAYGDGTPIHLVGAHRWDTMNRFDSVGTVGVPVESLTLSQMVEKFKIDPAGLMIKMDTEGAERYILENKYDIGVLEASAFFVAETHTYPEFSVSDIVDKLRTLKKSHRLYLIQEHNHLFIAMRRRDIKTVNPEQCAAVLRKRAK